MEEWSNHLKTSKGLSARTTRGDNFSYAFWAQGATLRGFQILQMPILSTETRAMVFQTAPPRVSNKGKNVSPRSQEVLHIELPVPRQGY